MTCKRDIRSSQYFTGKVLVYLTNTCFHPLGERQIITWGGNQNVDAISSWPSPITWLVGMRVLLLMGGWWGTACPQLLQKQWLLVALQGTGLGHSHVRRCSYQELGQLLSYFHDCSFLLAWVPHKAVAGHENTRARKLGRTHLDVNLDSENSSEACCGMNSLTVQTWREGKRVPSGCIDMPCKWVVECHFSTPRKPCGENDTLVPLITPAIVGECLIMEHNFFFF